MSGIAIVAGASLALTAYGALQANKADQTAASVDNATAAFNAKVDTENAQQIDLDTLQNIDTERRRIFRGRPRATRRAGSWRRREAPCARRLRTWAG
jgi:hypothetical protein